jgi:hypothetical protein
MTVGSINIGGFARIEPGRAMKALGNGLHLLEVHNREGAARMPSAPCRSAYTPGHHEQRAHADAISVSHDVLVAARDAASDRRDRAAFEKSLGHIGHSPERPYGPRLMNQLTVLGAVLASARHAVQGAPDNKELLGCQRKLESAIVDIGLKAGLYKKGIPTGGYQGDEASNKIVAAIVEGQEAMLTCRRVMGDSTLLDGIVSAVLPGAMMQSVLERLPNVAASYEGRLQELDLMQVLQKQHSDGMWRSVEHQMQTGCSEALANAVFGLLKLPEFVMEGEPASPNADKPPATAVPDGRFPPLSAMQSGGNQAINQNIVDNRGLTNALSGFADYLRSISNFSAKDGLAVGIDLGRAEAENAFLREQVAGLRTQNADLRNANTDIRNRFDNLERRFDLAQQRLNGWNENSTRFETKRDASNGTDSGRGSTASGDQIDAAFNVNRNEESRAGLDADSDYWESVGRLLNGSSPNQRVAADHSDHVSAFGDGEDPSAEAKPRSDSLRSDQQNGHGSRVPDAEFQRLQKLFPIQQPDAGGAPASERIDERQGSSALSSQSGGPTPQAVHASESDRDQTEFDVRDGVVQRDPYASVSRDRAGMSEDGVGRGIVERRELRNATTLNPRQTRSNGNQPDFIDSVEPGSVRRLIRHYEALESKAMRSSAQVASSALAEPHSVVTVASDARVQQSSLDAAAGRVRASSLSEQVADTDIFSPFKRLPRAWLDPAGGAARASALHGMAPNVAADQKLHGERDSLEAVSGTPIAKVKAVGGSRLPLSTADNFVEEEDNMQVQFSGWKPTPLDVGDNSAKAPVLSSQASQSSVPRATVERDSRVADLFQGVPSKGETGRLKDVIAELNSLIAFRAARGASVSAVKSQDEFRRFWEGRGGLAYAPIVAPVAAGKETFLLREHELERVFDQMAQNRSREDTPLLEGISRPRTDRGPTIRAAERWASRGADSSSIPVSEVREEVATAPSISALSDKNWALGPVTQRDMASKGLFKDAPSQIRQRHIAPVLKGWVGG